MRPLTALRLSGAVLCAAIISAMPSSHQLAAQTNARDGMALPRQVLTWYLTANAEQVWPHAGSTLREMFESPRGLREAGNAILRDMGPEVAVIGEQMFDHPEGGGAKVYVRASRHAQIPEIFWIVIFVPADKKVEMIMPQPRRTIRTLFPQVELPGA